MRSKNGTVRPNSSLSEHVAREIQRDYLTHFPSQQTPRQRRHPINTGVRRIKQLVFATAGGVKWVSVATGRKSAKLGGTLKRSVRNFAVSPGRARDARLSPLEKTNYRLPQA